MHIFFLTVLYVNAEFVNHDGNDAGNHVSNHDSNYDLLLLDFCLEPKLRVEMMNRIGLANQTGNFVRHVKPLIDKGLIKMILPDKPRSKRQRYITTPEGKKILRQ